MVHIKEYNRFKGHNSQDDLQNLAKDIFANGKIKEVVHHGYSTNHPEQGAKDGEMVYVENGSLCYVIVSEFAPVKYYVQMTGTTVKNISEHIDY